MYVCMYIHISVCIHVCIHVCMYVCMLVGWLVGWLSGLYGVGGVYRASNFLKSKSLGPFFGRSNKDCV